MTVLNTIEIMKTNDWLTVVIAVLAIGGFITIIASMSFDSLALIIIGTVTFAIAGLGSITCSLVENITDVNIFEIPSGKYQYEVIVQPEAWGEILEDYKIVDQRGDIYILEEKVDIE